MDEVRDSLTILLKKDEQLLLDVIETCRTPEEKIGIPGIYGFLAFINRIFDNKEKILDYYKKGLAIEQELYYPNHPDIGSSYASLGEINAELSNYDEALDCFDKAFRIYKEFWGEGHEKTIEVVDNWYETLNYVRSRLSISQNLSLWEGQKSHINKWFKDDLNDTIPDDREFQYAACLYNLLQPRASVSYLYPTENSKNLFLFILNRILLGEYELAAEAIELYVKYSLVELNC